ncbi:MAG: translation initiation factor IF-3 [Clostridia bacterium]|nr:translation initiation factor IF-3 [Clostridia bacterium]
MAKDDLQVNEEITAKEVRLIDEKGTMAGIVDIDTALKYAEDKNLDLVNIAPTANPPVCKVIDYNKYIFDLNKKEKDARRNQKVIEVKEVRLSPGIDDHDLNTKIKNAIGFLKDGDKVMAVVRFKGREMSRTSSGEEVINKFAEGVAEVGVMDKKPKLEGRRMSVIISPKK